jgi:hypothetical protein
LRKYIQANFNLHGIKPLDQKPILVLEILKDSAGLTKKDVAFLSKYFTVVDPSDKQIRSFFKGCDKSAVKAMSLLRTGIPIKNTLGEKIFGEMESTYKKFSLEYAFSAALLGLIAYGVDKELKAWFEKAPKQGRKYLEDKHGWAYHHVALTVGGGIVSAAVVAALVNYWYQTKHEKPETVPAVAYDFDDADDVISDAVVTDELEEEILAGDFMANR